MKGTVDQPAEEPIFRAIGGCEIRISNPCCLVVFGAYGDLAKRKLYGTILWLIDEEAAKN